MLDTSIIIGILAALLATLGLLLIYQRKSNPPKASESSGGARRRAAVPIRDEDGQILQLEGGPRGRRGGVRLRRTAAPQAQARVDQEGVVGHDEDDGEVDDTLEEDKTLLKMGKKKAEKMQAKAEKRLEREAFQRDLEEKKKQREKDDEEAKLKADQERQEEARLEAEEKKRQEEKERREYEEYLALKASFAVEEEGFDENVEEGAEENKLQEFINYIKETKVVLLEDLAAHFKMKAQDTIDRVTRLSADGVLTGVIDDRGKFIYISQSELEAVAKFIKQRGRVSITELAENSNKLIAINTS